MRSISRLGLSVVLGLIVVGCGGIRGPSQSDVEKYLQSTVPEYIQLQNVRCENFMDANSASGRISCAGTVVLKDDLYGNSSQAWGELVSEFGQDFIFYASRVPGDTTVIEVASTKGTEQSFGSTIQVEKIVDGWNFSGGIDYPGFEGRPRKQMPSGSMVRGDPAYEERLQKVRDEAARFLAVKQEFATTIEQFFQPGKTITVINEFTKQPALKVRVTAAPAWTHEQAKKSAFIVPAEAVSLSRIGGAGARLKEGATLKAEFRGTIIYNESGVIYSDNTRDPPGWQSRVELHSTGAIQTYGNGRVEELDGLRFVDTADWKPQEKIFKYLDNSSWIRDQ